MISSTKLASLASTLAADSVGTSAQNATTPFDTILTLESVAATGTLLDPEYAGTMVEGACGAELSPTELEDADDKDGPDDEDPLAFLADLLNAAAVVPQPTTPSQSTGEGGDTSDDAIAIALGGHGRHQANNSDNPISLTPPAPDTGADGTTGVAAGVIPGTNSVDAAAAQKLLAAVDPALAAIAAAATDVDGVRSDAAQSPDGSAASLARAAELLGHGPRHVAGVSRDYIVTPARDPQWAQDFSARVSMMVRGGESNASLQLAPADLGPVDVNVMVRDSQATIHFGAAQAETRALIEASIPRLREMLAAQGFNLMDASVSQGFARQARSDSPTPIRLDGEPELEVRTTARVGPLGLLDTYA